jgi:hypothetical protein
VFGKTEQKKKKKKHQAYFANKINIYEDKKTEERWETSQNTSKHTHTDLRDENKGGKKERVKEQETGITVIRTVSSAYVEWCRDNHWILDEYFLYQPHM